MDDDVLMMFNVADMDPTKIDITRTMFMEAREFRSHEDYYKKYRELVEKLFQTRGKHDDISGHATWYALTFDESGEIVGFALVIEVGQKWLIEYVMVAPEYQNQGYCGRLIRSIHRQAIRRKARWLILNCKPKITRVYASYGFRKLVKDG